MALRRLCFDEPVGPHAVDQAPVVPVVVLFDGHCALCHRSVRLLHSLDRHDRLQYAPLTAEWTAAFPGGVVVWTPDRAVGGADAVVAALRMLGRSGRILAFIVCATPGYQKIYRWIATHRYTLFGRAKQDLTSCPAPNSWRGRPLRFSQTPPLHRH
ncbi:MAG: DUF393 domain-containing protein [Bacteroidetes bacterium]|nr:DUF393 domain-containing protein [Bacteroidota bacterium]